MKRHPQWLTGALQRVRELAAERKVQFTYKALRELAELGLDEEDACQALENLATPDFTSRVRSRRTQEWMYIFKPSIADILVYLKVILRDECVVISFHEDIGGERNDDEDSAEKEAG